MFNYGRPSVDIHDSEYDVSHRKTYIPNNGRICMPVYLMFGLCCHGVQYAVEHYFQSHKCIILIVNANLNSR